MHPDARAGHRRDWLLNKTISLAKPLHQPGDSLIAPTHQPFECRHRFLGCQKNSVLRLLETVGLYRRFRKLLKRRGAVPTNKPVCGSMPRAVVISASRGW
jgi:hypothetical protein